MNVDLKISTINRKINPPQTVVVARIYSGEYKQEAGERKYRRSGLVRQVTLVLEGVVSDEDVRKEVKKELNKEVKRLKYEAIDEQK